MEQQFTQLLDSHGIRPSLQRLLIYDYLATHKTHPTVDTIYNDLAPKIPTLSKTTVYNTLKTFLDTNLVQSVTIEDDELRYDADVSPHTHFKCTKCGTIHDIFQAEPLPHTFPAGFFIEKKQLYVWGLCPNCAEN